MNFTGEKKKMINHEEKFIHVPIPKTATQSLNKALGFGGLPEPALYHDNIEHFISQDYLQHINYYKFSIVRNPWDRLTSLWRDFVNKRQFQYSGYHRCDKRLLLSDFKNFEDMCLNLKDSLWSQNLFFKPQVYFLSYAGEIKVDYVGRFENLHQSYIDICKALNKEQGTLQVINQTIHPGDQTQRKYRQYYNEKTAAAIADFYRLDIKEFGYDF